LNSTLKIRNIIGVDIIVVKAQRPEVDQGSFEILVPHQFPKLVEVVGLHKVSYCRRVADGIEGLVL
jgi:hypothetical protein